jgi:hypothetical protein
VYESPGCRDARGTGSDGVERMARRDRLAYGVGATAGGGVRSQVVAPAARSSRIAG